jgi:hypothetical protein
MNQGSQGAVVTESLRFRTVWAATANAARTTGGARA